MENGALAHRIYDLLVSHWTGLIALIVAVAGITKNLFDSRKSNAQIKEIKAHVNTLEAQRESLLADSVLKRIQSEQLEYQLRSLKEHRPEIEKSLDVIREHSTSMYNEVITVYEPFLAGSPKLTKNKLKEKMREVQRFAREQKHRPSVEEAWNFLRQVAEQRAT